MGDADRMKVIILSGGMDSTTLLYDIARPFMKDYHVKDKPIPIKAISFNYNQRHKKELECAKETCKKFGIEHKIVDLTGLNEIAPSSLTRENQAVPHGHYADETMKSTVVPNRNMVMISLAVSYAIGIGANEVYYGAHAGDHAVYPDCRPQFIEVLRKAISLCDDHMVQLCAPYAFKDKKNIAKIGKLLDVDYSLTWTCYEGGDKACGVCGACVERLEAFRYAGMKDPVEYKEGVVR